MGIVIAARQKPHIYCFGGWWRIKWSSDPRADAAAANWTMRQNLYVPHPGSTR